MAIVERFFSTTSSGAGDGTTWANRAALFSSGNLSSIITSFDFSTDSLTCCIGPGSYSGTQQWASGIFTTPPTQSSIGRWLLKGCDSNGVALVPPDLGWNCAQGPLDTSANPSIDLAVGNVSSIAGTICVSAECVNFTKTSGNGTIWQSAGGSYRWGKITNSVANNSSSCVSSNTSHFGNAEFECSGTSFLRIVQITNFNNIRLIGNSGATSGDRWGLFTSNASGPVFVSGCVIGVRAALATAANVLFAYRVTAVNCGTGISLPTSASGGVACLTVYGSMVANCTVGVSQAFGRYELANVRLRNTTNVDPANVLPGNDVLTASGSDTDEFVNAASGDYRIKNTSIYWGRNIGAGDEPASATGSSGFTGIRGVSRRLGA
jgi:hypothetical protein